MTSKTKNFNLDVNDMFATKDTQQTEPQQDTRSHKKAERSKTVNHSAKRVNSTTEPRSQRKQFLFTKETSVNMKVLAMSKKISVNEMVNEVMEDYIKKQFKKNPEVKSLASKILELERN